MLFHTWVFLVFIAIVYPVHLLVRRHNGLMNLWLMLASYTFYGWWNPWYLLLLFGTSAVDYLMVVLMERSGTRGLRKLWLVVSLVSNFGLLGYFKYSEFLTANLNLLLENVSVPLQLPPPVVYANSILSTAGAPEDWLFEKVVLPIGISFHTFQSMSYTIDAYFGTIKTERSFIRFLTFVSFFPQLVAGPIERAHHLLPQLQTTPTITARKICDGLSLFLVGFFKKVALADYLARYVDPVFGNPSQYGAPTLILAAIAFGWQIYFDFAGYTDMARGIAEAMGFRLMLNFNNPYAASGLGDFWNRWHISLSTWFKDYVYFPLGGNRGAKWATYRNMFLTMVVSGVWHGSEWTYVVWGAVHALARCLTRDFETTEAWKHRVPRLVKQTLVFAFVTFAWIFFRCQNLDDAGVFLTRIFTTGWSDPQMPLLMAGLIAAVWAYQLLWSDSMRGALALRAADRADDARDPDGGVLCWSWLSRARRSSSTSSSGGELMQHDEGIAGISNGIRLGGREWLVVAVVALGLVVGGPLWAEPVEPPAEARIPHELGNDYWLYRRYAERAAERDDIVLFGDSVVWGEYAKRGETLSAHLNLLAGSEKYANLGLDGAHPLALAGLVEHFAAPIAGKKAIVVLNPLWYTSAKADLRDPKATDFNHPRLVPQFDFAMTSMKEDVSTRLGNLVFQRWNFPQWTTHLQQTYFQQTDVPGWTLEHPYADPLEPLRKTTDLAGDKLRHLQEPWTKSGIGLQDYPWIEPDASLQWAGFRRTVELLRKRGNTVFVVLGPFNEHLLTAESRGRYRDVKTKLAAWMTVNGVPHVVPEPLPSGEYGDASHPLHPAGYERLAKTLWETASFRTFQ